MRRYTAVDEHAFFPDALPEPLLPPLEMPVQLAHNAININAKIASVYQHRLLEKLCPRGDDGNYGSSVVCDIAALQALSKRIHYGKFIAEAKFQAEREKVRHPPPPGARRLSQPPTAAVHRLHQGARCRCHHEGAHKAHRRGGRAGTGPPQGRCLRARPAEAARRGGEDRSTVRGRVCGSLGASCVPTDHRRLIKELYAQWVMPLTKEVQVEYLLQRLAPAVVAFVGHAVPADAGAAAQCSGQVAARTMLERGAPPG